MYKKSYYFAILYLENYTVSLIYTLTIDRLDIVL